MNTKQRTALLIGTVLFLLMGLFPPWQYSMKTSPIVRRNAGFRFIMSPQDVDLRRMAYIFGLREPEGTPSGFQYIRAPGRGRNVLYKGNFEAQINTSQLLLQWLMLLGTCAGLFLLLRTPTKGVNKPVETVPGEPDEPAQPQDTAPLEEQEDHLDTVKEKPSEEPEEVVPAERSLAEPEDHKSRQQSENQKDNFSFNLVAAILGGFALIFLVYLGTPDRSAEVTSVRKEASRAARVEADPEDFAQWYAEFLQGEKPHKNTVAPNKVQRLEALEKFKEWDSLQAANEGELKPWIRTDETKTAPKPKTTFGGGGGELFASIFLNWIIGLGPAVFFRLFGGPFSKRKAKITTGIIGFCLFVMVLLAAHGLGVTPNMAPVAVWTFATYAILRYDANRLYETPT